MNIDERNEVTETAPVRAADKVVDKKQRNQVIMLGGLAALLVVVLFIQFSNSEPEFEVSALTSEALVGGEGDTEDAADILFDGPIAKGNPVLLQGKDDEGMLRNAFSNFWDNASADEARLVEFTPPSIKLSGTMPGEGRAIAIIDGRIQFLGDTIDGWKLSEIRPRAVVLTGPGGANVVIDMPVIFGRVSVPEGLEIPAEQPTMPSEDDFTDAYPADAEDS